METPPKITRTLIDMTLKCLPDVGISKKAQNQNKTKSKNSVDITGLVCKLQTKIPKNQKF